MPGVSGFGAGAEDHERRARRRVRASRRVFRGALLEPGRRAEAMEEELVAEAAGKPKSKTTKAKTTKAKTTKTTTKGKEKTACQFCGKLYVFIDKHEKKCKKNPENQ